jgi:hypothetical protein
VTNSGDEYTSTPVSVGGVSPDDGPAGGGNVVVISGTGFGNPGDADTAKPCERH